MGSETIASDDSRDNSLTSEETSNYLWTASSELALFQAMISHKPAGINKHFSMSVVSEKLSGQFGGEICSDMIWSKLRTMFDLTAVDDREEVIPFNLEEKEFSLPRRDFSSLIIEKQKEINKDKTAGKTSKTITRVSIDMGSVDNSNINIVPPPKKEKETPALKQQKAEQKVDAKEKEETAKVPTKRHVTRSTPNSTPAKKRK